MNTVIGLEKFIMKDGRSYQKARLGLLANQASVGHDYVHAVRLLDEAMPGAVVALFGPQHGWAGEKQDNMVESAHGRDRQGRPIYSLYGETRRPTPEMLADLDALVVDLVDVGTRVYTFAHTLSYCLEAAAERGLEVIILDRPNPIGGVETEGNILADDCQSFVGLHPIPMRHGLTLGELAGFINKRLPKPAPLNVVTCEGWQRDKYWAETGLPWVYPSPNLPTLDSVWAYPGAVLWEGANISEGRGTTRPFNLVGAPYINSEKLCERLTEFDLPGFSFRPAYFQPTFNKWAGEMCHGLELFPKDKSFKPYFVNLVILKIILEEWETDFSLKAPPYEYEFNRRPLDLILGDKSIFNRLLADESVEDIEKSWLPDLTRFNKERAEFLLY